MVTLEALPDELLRHILGFLDEPADLAAALAAARALHAASQAASLWKRRARLDFGVEAEALWDGWGWGEFYRRVLFPFRHLTGWWLRNFKFYGGVLQVKVEATGINGYVMDVPLDDSFLTAATPEPFPPILPPKDFDATRLPPNPKTSRVLAPGAPKPTGLHLAVLPTADWSRASRHRWRPRLLFSLTHVGRRLRLYCYQSDLGLADAIGHLSCATVRDDPDYDTAGGGLRCTACDAASLTPTPKGFTFACHQAHALDMLDYGFPLEHGLRVSDRRSFGPVLQHLLGSAAYQHRLAKFGAQQDARSIAHWSLERLGGPRPIPPAIRDGVFRGWAEAELPQPGLYFGSYSCHGLEVVDFQYAYSASGRPLLEARKITGDPNVPAPELSLRVFLDVGLLLSAEAQGSLGGVRAAMSAAGPDGVDTTGLAFRAQPFRLPPELEAEPSGAEPDVCGGRWMGEGQIAGADFYLPSWTEVVVAVLGPGLLGVLWPHLRAHSLFFRAEEQAPPDPSP